MMAGSPSASSNPRRRSARLVERNSLTPKIIPPDSQQRRKSKGRIKSTAGSPTIEEDDGFVFKRRAISATLSSSVITSGQGQRTVSDSTGVSSFNSSSRSRKSTRRVSKELPVEPPSSQSIISEGTTTLIPLPLSDTPIIRRNQQLRKQSNRRSSLTNRGKRVSSIGSGFTAVPHGEIEPQVFFRHVNSDMPEPYRMKQILLWSFKRILDEQTVQLKKLRESRDNTDERTAFTIGEHRVKH